MADKTKKETTAATAQETAATLAKAALTPSVNAAAVIEAYGAPMGSLDIAALVNDLSDSVEKVSHGNMGRCEAMLLGQAHALQAIFMNLSRRAVKQECLNNYETYLRLALKAQGQCRATLETLAEIKSPRQVAFVQQANIANGPQQVNNGTPPSNALADKPPRVRTKQNSPTQLLEEHHGQRLDTRATGAAGRTDQELEAVGAINRPKNRGR